LARGEVAQEIGKRVAERFVASPHISKFLIRYAEVCTWYGSLTFAQLAGDRDLTSRLIQRMGPLLTSEEASLIPAMGSTWTYRCSARYRLEIYIQTKERKYLDLGLAFADKQWENPTPRGSDQGDRFWIDDMYMITELQVQAFRATGDRKYLDRAALEMAAYLDKLQQPNGLFYMPRRPFFWGRGNGWVAAGMSELLRSLPQEPSATSPDSGGLPEDDGVALELPGRGRHVAPTDRSSGVLEGDLIHGHVRLRQ